MPRPLPLTWAAIGLWSIALPTTIDTILKALAPAMKDSTPAAHHANMGGHTFFGNHPKTGRRFVLQTIDGGGWGAVQFGGTASAGCRFGFHVADRAPHMLTDLDVLLPHGRRMHLVGMETRCLDAQRLLGIRFL